MSEPIVLSSAASKSLFLSSTSAFLFDCDGVLWSGDHLFPGVDKTISSLRSSGKKTFFVTNNSTKSRESYASKLTKLGIDTSIEDVVTSSSVTAAWLSSQKVKKVFALGEAGLREELELAGISVICADDKSWQRDIEEEDYDSLLPGGKLHDDGVEAVVAGLDRKINYFKLCAAFQHLRRLSGKSKDGESVSPPTDRPFLIATNPDSTLPTHKSLFLGASTTTLAPLLNALNKGDSKFPHIILGKPAKAMLSTIMETYSLSQKDTVMVGDRLDTDIVFGTRGGLRTLAVGTGVSSREEFWAGTDDKEGEEDGGKLVKPTYYISGLGELC